MKIAAYLRYLIVSPTRLCDTRRLFICLLVC